MTKRFPMRIRSAIISCVLILLISVGLFPTVIKKASEAPSLNAFGKGTASSNSVYYLDGANDGMRLFSLGTDGTVQSVYADPKTTATDICLYDGKVFVLVNDVVRFDGPNVYRAYRLKGFTQSLVPCQTTASFELHAGEKAVDVNIENGQIFVSALSIDADTVEAYSLSLDELTKLYEEQQAAAEEETEDAEPAPAIADVQAESFYLDYAEKGRFFADATFKDGVFFTRTDADLAEDVFAPNETVNKALKKVSLSLSQCMKLSMDITIYWIAGTLILMVAVIFCFVMLSGKVKAVYIGLGIEALIAIVLIILYNGFTNYKDRYVKEAREKYAYEALSLLAGQSDRLTYKEFDESWYDSNTYKKVQRTINTFVSGEYASEVFTDAFLVDVITNNVICSADGRNNEQISDLYGKSDLWEKLIDKKSSDIYELSVAGKNIEAIAVMPNDDANAAFVGIIDADNGKFDKEERMDLIRNMFVSYVVFSGLCIFLLWLLTFDISLFDKAIGDVAVNGKSVNLGPKNPVGTDLENMWNSLRQIEKEIGQLQYSSFKRLEAYSRFAPQDIEKILGKESILDVVNGDRIGIKGTLSMITSDGSSDVDERIDQIGGLFNFMKEYPDLRGTLVSDRDGLSSIDMFFYNQERNTCEFAVDYLKECRVDRASIKTPSVFMYYGSFMYAVTGTNEQSRAFLIADESSELAAYAKWFRDHDISAVVTEEVKNRERTTYDFRYIGFINIGDRKKDIRLYELLDACPLAERELKLEYMNKFEDALQLFYQSDYYMARNTFSDILKVNPGDEIVRWYLFESERLLDDTSAIGGKQGALHF